MVALSRDRLVWLRGGLCVPVEPYLLLLRLESQGFRFQLDADGTPCVAPFNHLAADDLAALRRWRYHVALLLRYTPDDSHLVVTPDDGVSRVRSAIASRRTA